jgi:cytochrome P450
MCLAHFDPERYPEPHTFRPSRFLGEARVSSHEYFPWGGGARRCLGAAFAMTEMKIVLGTWVRAASLTLVDPPARPMMRAATVGPRGGVRVVRARA